MDMGGRIRPVLSYSSSIQLFLIIGKAWGEMARALVSPIIQSNMPVSNTLIVHDGKVADIRWEQLLWCTSQNN